MADMNVAVGIGQSRGDEDSSLVHRDDLTPSISRETGFDEFHFYGQPVRQRSSPGWVVFAGEPNRVSGRVPGLQIRRNPGPFGLRLA
jgi:hypothetical protein